MNRFDPEQKRDYSRLRRIASTAAVFLAAVFLLLAATLFVSRSSTESQAESLRLAVTRSAVHCYAVEGRYPESLTYIKEHYGIRWDEDRYLVVYEITGSNLMPTVTVITRS